MAKKAEKVPKKTGHSHKFVVIKRIGLDKGVKEVSQCTCGKKKEVIK